MNTILRRLAATLVLSTLIGLAFLALFASPGAPAARQSGLTVASFADEVRRAAAWLDQKTTPQGAFLWPLTGDICGLPRR